MNHHTPTPCETIFSGKFNNFVSQNSSEMHYFTCKNYKVSAKCTKNPPPAVELFQKSASSTRHQDERANISDRVFVLREVRDILVDRYFTLCDESYHQKCRKLAVCRKLSARVGIRPAVGGRRTRNFIHTPL